MGWERERTGEKSAGAKEKRGGEKERERVREKRCTR